MAEKDIFWVTDLLLETTVEEAGGFAQDQIARIKTRAREVFKGYYKLLASRGKFMDVEEPPAALGVDWEPISKKWASYKKYVMMGRPKGKGSRNALAAAGNPNRHFFGISSREKGSKRRPNLMTFVAKRDPFKDFGEPSVEINRVEGLRRGVQLNRDNKPYYQSRKYGRGYASRGDAFDIFFNIEIAGFGDLDGMSEYNILGRLGDGKMAGIMRTHEFGGPGIKGSTIPARPLFIPYLRWFIDTGFRQLMRNV